MSVSAFPYGTMSGEQITAEDESVFDVAISPADARAGIQYETDGETLGRKNGGNTSLTDWVTPTSAASGSYEVRCNATGDALKSGSAALNTWLALSTQRHWEIEVTGIGVKSATLTVDFRKNGGSIIKTVTITLNAEVEV